MYQKVLLPLDGSKTAEAVPDHVKKLSKERLVGEVMLVMVVGRQSMVTDGGIMSVMVARHRKESKIPRSY